MAARHSIGIDHPTVVPEPEPPVGQSAERTGGDGATDLEDGETTA